MFVAEAIEEEVGEVEDLGCADAEVRDVGDKGTSVCGRTCDGCAPAPDMWPTDCHARGSS